jgi:hypothetical protein
MPDVIIFELLKSTMVTYYALLEKKYEKFKFQ